VEATLRPSRSCDALGAPVALPQHPDEHRPKRPVVLAIDQEFGEGAALRVAPELTDLGVNNRRGDARRVLSPW
jgi:hypothetical protein